MEKTAGAEPLEGRRQAKLLIHAEKMKRMPGHPLHQKLKDPTKNQIEKEKSEPHSKRTAERTRRHPYKRCTPVWKTEPKQLTTRNPTCWDQNNHSWHHYKGKPKWSSFEGSGSGRDWQALPSSILYTHLHRWLSWKRHKKRRLWCLHQAPRQTSIICVSTWWDTVLKLQSWSLALLNATETIISWEEKPKKAVFLTDSLSAQTRTHSISCHDTNRSSSFASEQATADWTAISRGLEERPPLNALVERRTKHQNTTYSPAHSISKQGSRYGPLVCPSKPSSGGLQRICSWQSNMRHSRERESSQRNHHIERRRRRRRQTEHHEALQSSANDEVRCDCTCADDGNASWYSVCRVPMVEWRLDCEDCRHLTVVGLHDTGLWGSITALSVGILPGRVIPDWHSSGNHARCLAC